MPLWFLPGNAFGLQASNKFFIHSFCVFSQISSITAQPSRNVRDASDNAAGKPRTEWVEIFSYCVKSCGIYIASPSDSTWLGILRTNYVGGVAQLAQPLMRILTSLQTRTYPTFTERVRMSRSPPPVVIKLWACSVRVLLPRLWLAEGQYAGLFLLFASDRDEGESGAWCGFLSAWFETIRAKVRHNLKF